MVRIDLTQSGRAVLEKRYLARDASGKVCETPEEMFRRVAKCVATTERLYAERSGEERVERAFFNAMSRLEFLPNSPALMNAGRKLGQLAACFVLPVEDSLQSIFEAVKQAALIHQSGGGTGFSFSRLRPANDVVGSTGAGASGPVSFMAVFNAASEAVKQGGARRGANMGLLRVDHPDIEAFIGAKEDPTALTNFNISVAITDAFMEALEKGFEYDLVNPRTGLAVARKRASEVMNRIIGSAWRNGEPGIVFIDRINASNPTPGLGDIEAVNPCAEQPLLANEPCCLGSINLARMMTRAGRRWEIDYKKFDETIRLAVRFLDDAIDASRFPLPEIESMAKGNRKIGLGVMGFADVLIRLRVAYGSDKSLKVAEEIMKFFSETAAEESRALGAIRGPFPNADRSIYAGTGARPPRNATVTTIAPTGTLSVIAGCSSGIEPYYSPTYTRRILDGERHAEINPHIAEVLREEGLYSSALMDFVSSGGNLSDRKDVPQRVKELFTPAFEIGAQEHVKVQATFQRHVDNAVSKTVNMPEYAAPEDVRTAYMLAWKLGCKGITVYRTGSREAQVLSCSDTSYC